MPNKLLVCVYHKKEFERYLATLSLDKMRTDKELQILLAE